MRGHVSSKKNRHWCHAEYINKNKYLCRYRFNLLLAPLITITPRIPLDHSFVLLADDAARTIEQRASEYFCAGGGLRLSGYTITLTGAALFNHSQQVCRKFREERTRHMHAAGRGEHFQRACHFEAAVERDIGGVRATRVQFKARAREAPFWSMPRATIRQRFTG